MVLDIIDSASDDQEKLSYLDMFREGTQTFRNHRIFERNHYYSKKIVTLKKKSVF
jgi:hypothetical protein